jgi:hypothetical protein
VFETYPIDTAAPLGDHQLAITEFTARDYYHYPLTIQAGPGRELGLRVQFRTDVFDAASIEVLIERYKRVLVAMAADPTRRISSIDVLDAAEHTQLDEIGNRAVLTRPAPPPVSVPVVFAAQVARTPEAVAISCAESLTPNNKLDTRALPAPEYTAGEYRAPASAVEEMLAGIYAQVLGLERVGVDDSFFDLGGDSLSAMRLVAAINTGLDAGLGVRTLFDAPSVRSLSRHLDTHASSDSFASVDGRGGEVTEVHTGDLTLDKFIDAPR